MNLLEQLANSCHKSLSINFIQSSPSSHKQIQPISNNNYCSSIIKQNINNVQSKSIQKIYKWKPSTQQHFKQKIIIKFISILSNKVRKYYYGFWISIQQIMRNNKYKLQSKKIAIQHLFNFIHTHTSKSIQNYILYQSFIQIKKYSKIILFSITLETILSQAIKKKYQIIMFQLNSTFKSFMKFDLFVNSINVLLLTPIKLSTFRYIKSVYFNPNIKSTLLQSLPHHQLQPPTKQSKPILLKPLLLKTLTYFQKDQIISHLKFQQTQHQIKPYHKIPLDQIVQNYPQNCTNINIIDDNNFLFIQKPQEKQKQLVPNTGKQNKNIFNDLIYLQTKRYPLKQSIPSLSIQQYEIKNKNNKAEQTLKKKQSKNIFNKSMYIPFNLDQKRIQILQNKIFGHNNHYQSNRFSVNGTNWKDDRQTLLEIMYNIKKSPPKIKRHSTCTLTENKQIDKPQIVNQNIKQKPSTLQNSPHNTIPSSDQKTMLMKQLLYRYQKQNREKNQSKIMVSVKLKKRKISLPNTPNHKHYVQQKFNQQEKDFNCHHKQQNNSNFKID